MTYAETQDAIRKAGCAEGDLVLLALIATKTALYCLVDWIETTGCGEVNRRDRRALAAIVKFIDTHRQSCAMWGVELEENADLERARKLTKGYV